MTASPINTPKPSAPPKRGFPGVKLLLQVGGAILALGMVFALMMFRIYGVETHHASRGRIWWPEQCRSLIPPTAVDITLRRDLLDHYAIYTVTEKDLNAFLNQRFASPGKTLDSFKERTRVKPADVGKTIGLLGWVITKDTVVYNYYASNGGAHGFYHDTETGRTYQSSAYW